MNQFIKYMGLMVFSSFFNSSVLAQPAFIEASFGAGFHRIELGNESSVISTGEYLSMSVGMQMKHTLSLSSSLRVWNTGEEDDNSDIAEHNLFHDFHFTGISLGMDAQLFLPALAEGPYLKGGRHCWSANVSEVFNIWNGSGCSNLVGAGFLMRSNNGNKGAVFGEIILTRFKYVNSWMLAVGGRF